MHVPTLVFADPGDDFTRTVESSRHFASHIFGARLVELSSGADGFRFHWYGRADPILEEVGRFLAESAEAQISMHEGVPIAVDLPASVVLTITKTDPGAKGDTRTGAMKPATLDTGVVVNVPLFVEGLREQPAEYPARRFQARWHRAAEPPQARGSAWRA